MFNYPYLVDCKKLDNANNKINANHVSFYYFIEDNVMIIHEGLEHKPTDKHDGPLPTI